MKTCKACQSVNFPTDQNKMGKIHMMGVDYLGQKWIIDTLLVLQTDLGKRYHMVVHKMCTKSWKVKTLKEESPQGMARFYCNKIFLWWGLAELVCMNRGTEYNVEIADKMMRILGTRHLLGASGHPQFSGQVERGNRVILVFLQKFCKGSKDWDKYLLGLHIVFNTSMVKSMGENPYFFNHERDFKMLLEVAAKPPSRTPL